MILFCRLIECLIQRFYRVHLNPHFETVVCARCYCWCSPASGIVLVVGLLFLQSNWLDDDTVLRWMERRPAHRTELPSSRNNIIRETIREVEYIEERSSNDDHDKKREVQRTDSRLNTAEHTYFCISFNFTIQNCAFVCVREKSANIGIRVLWLWCGLEYIEIEPR